MPLISPGRLFLVRIYPWPGSGRCWAGSRCYRYRRDRWIVVQSATESVYKLAGVRRGVAKIGHKWGNFGLCCCGWQTVGSALDEKSFTVSRTGQTGILWCPFRDQKGNSGLQDEGVGITLAAYMHVSRSWVYCRKILVYCRLQFWT